MPTLLDMASELASQIPGLPNLFARKFINRAFEEIKKDRLWSWNIGEGVLVMPQLITGPGVCTVTQFSKIVQFDTAAQTTLLPTVLANPPLNKRQFRISGGPVYSIVAYDTGSGQATLDRIYTESNASGVMFTIYRCYYEPPSTDGTFETTVTDFLRYLSINNPIQGYVIAGRRLYLTGDNLNRRDPLRGAQGNPYYVASYKPNSVGQMQHEFWPHPTFSQTMIAKYEKNHYDLAPSDSFPAQCSIPLIQYRAFEHAYRWAGQNAGRIPELKGVDWRFYLAEVQSTYRKELVTAKKNDNEILLEVIKMGGGGSYDYQGPIDSDYYQNHGLPAL